VFFYLESNDLVALPQFILGFLWQERVFVVLMVNNYLTIVKISRLIGVTG